mmetsp:Transcript_10714/g.27049  ORF Transcript_10714/g.27049 Transcript_10714/m.27049 type:complete len:216 (-) Transcript_10714:464-1111(-)
MPAKFLMESFFSPSSSSSSIFDLFAAEALSTSSLKSSNSPGSFWSGSNPSSFLRSCFLRFFCLDGSLKTLFASCSDFCSFSASIWPSESSLSLSHKPFSSSSGGSTVCAGASTLNFCFFLFQSALSCWSFSSWSLAISSSFFCCSSAANRLAFSSLSLSLAAIRSSAVYASCLALYALSTFAAVSICCFKFDSRIGIRLCIWRIFFFLTSCCKSS